jgi:hypothetical protein
MYSYPELFKKSINAFSNHYEINYLIIWIENLMKN